MPEQNESAEEQVRRLKQELDDLKLRHAAVCEERDRFAERNTDLRLELDELETARATLGAAVDQLRESVEALFGGMAEADRRRRKES